MVDPATGDERATAVFDARGRLTNPAEAIGELIGRSPHSAFEGYYKDPEAEAERIRDGWYWSGDLAYRDADGVFYFAGRSGDWLRVDSENFTAAPIERILGRFPGLRGVAVYAVPDTRTGDQVMAALELDDPGGLRPGPLRRVPRRSARPRDQVGAALPADGARPAGDRDRQGGQGTAARCPVVVGRPLLGAPGPVGGVHAG